MRAVLITGPPGSGKTSVLTALSDALSDDDVPHGVLEAEAVAWTSPGLDDDARRRHVRVNAALLRKARPQLLLVGDTIESEDELAALREAVAAEVCFVVRLHAEPETLAERIIAREPPHWSGLAELVEHARTMPPVAGADLELSTEGETAAAVAARIRETARL
jgi:broad-specificity NMP kinase